MSKPKSSHKVQESAETQPHSADRDLEAEQSKDSQDDELFTQRTGKKPVLKRNFGFTSILGFGCLTLCTWLGAFVLLGVGLENGGPAGLLYSFVLVWAGNTATFATLAELSSMAPTAGGQYHWVAILAPDSCQRILSYVTGWLTVAGWQASVAASAYVLGMLIQGFIEVVDSSYSPKLWHVTLLLYGTVALSVLATTVIGTVLPGIESALLVLYVLEFFGILVPLVYLSRHSSAPFVFTTFLNDGGWSSQTLSFFVGISGNAFAFLGADSVYHMSEEVQNAAIVVPRSLLCGITLSGVLGTAMYLAILFCLDDLQAVVTSQYVYPFIEVLMRATKSAAGTAVILAVLIILDLGLVIGVVAASSRMLWSFARDRGVPGWRRISQVNQSNSIPTTAIITTTIVALLLGLISVGSPVAFNDVISLTVSALYASYFMACVLLLWRRCWGSISDISQVAPGNDRLINTNVPGCAGKLVWGPWKMPELLGKAVNMIACAYLFVVFLFTFWPPATPVTPSTMNYSCVVMGFVAIVSGLYYKLRAYKVYTGPVVDVDVQR